MTVRRKGRLVVAGVGPGDPGLATARLLAALGTADVVLAPGPLPDELDAALAPGAEVVVAADPTLLVDRAKAGATAVWLLPGDGVGDPGLVAAWPTLVRSRLPVELLPGVSAAAAAAAYAGMPLAPAVAIADGADVGWAAAAPTVVVPVAPGAAGTTAAALVAAGVASETPAVLVVEPTTARQRTHAGRLGDLPDVPAGGVLVVGAAAAERRVGWWEGRPLFGARVVVPRARQQAGSLSAELRSLGADPLEVPTIVVEPPRNPATLDKAVAGIVSGRYAWVAFTSANAVSALRDRIELVGCDARIFAGVKLAAVGTATAEALHAFGLRADLVPTGVMTAEALGRAWPPRDDRLDPLDRVLLPRADIATETLVAAVKAKGWLVDEVTAYRTVRAPAPPEPVRVALRQGDVDAIVFTSSSTVRNFVALCGLPHESVVVAVIGPQTAATAREIGLHVDVEARQSTVAGVAQALAAHVATRTRPAPPKGRTRTPARSRAGKASR